jgi:hypothetical protein
MRIASSLALLALVCIALASAQTTSPPAPATIQKASLSAEESTLTGCLKGSTDEFYLTERNGTMHVLMGHNRDLRPYVDHWVELGGNRDNSRDASASSDEGTAHGLRFFQVEEIVADNGVCKR